MRPLFGYGTLRHTAWRCAILGADYPTTPATLAGWRRIATPTGYLSLRETLPRLDVGLVEGCLIELDAVGWAIADAWEEVPLYERREVVVNTMSGSVAATIYVHGQPDEATPVDDDCLALLTEAEVEAAIEAFGPTMRALRRLMTE